MRILVALEDNSLEASIASNFDHAPWFGLYDKMKKTSEMIPNPYSRQNDESGIKITELLLKKNIDVAMAGRFGLRVMNHLSDQKIRLILPTRTMEFREVIARIKLRDTDGSVR